MSKSESLPITLSGGPPPQKNIPSNLTEEDMVLYAAWAHGMSAGDVVHRYALFAFIQSHIANKAEEPLQKIIENSPYWQWFAPGKYALNNSGYKRITEYFNHLPSKIEVNGKYIFNRVYDERKFSIIVNSIAGKLQPLIDGNEISGVKACAELESMGAIFNVKSNSRTARLLNWIVQDSDYSWRRIDLKSILRVEEPSPEISAETNEFSIENDEEAFLEGEKTYKLHRSRERNATVVRLAKKRGKEKDFSLRCQICNFSFVETYGDLGEGFIEAHHTIPLSELSEEIETKIKDIALICSNCHQMLHRCRPWLSIAELKKFLANTISNVGNKAV